MTDAVLADRRGGALWLTINRPERRNALNSAVIEGICAGLRGAEADDGVRAIVLTGTGDKAFCAGGDMQADTGFDVDGTGSSFADMLRLGLASSKVIIARVNGVCLAGGMGLLGIADLAVAVDTARFGLPEVRVGLFPMQVVAVLLRDVARRRIAEWSLTGESFSAQAALESGLVNRVVSAASLDSEIDRIVEQVEKGSASAIASGKAALSHIGSLPLDKGLTFAEQQLLELLKSADAREGIAAFLDKRPPNWSRKA